jgi:diguanylate cyclase (GGDEF)-like protein
MEKEFYKSIVDSLPQQIALIDCDGAILYVNHAWNRFAEENSCELVDWNDQNYLETCRRAAQEGDLDALKVSKGILEVINGSINTFKHEYPCHSPTEHRWFQVSVTAIKNTILPTNYYVVSHLNITDRKLAELRVESLSMIDELTGIANRRAFEMHYQQKWFELMRSQEWLSLAYVDVDNFKQVNDQNGHVYGDKILSLVAKQLNKSVKRAGDLCARIGGDEFVLVFTRSNPQEVETILGNLLENISNFEFQECLRNPQKQRRVSVSVGLVSVVPNKQYDRAVILSEADNQLYSAKKSGRSQLKSKLIDIRSTLSRS